MENEGSAQGQFELEERRVAIHEAGPAVADCLLGRRFVYVTILPDEDCAGHIRQGDLANTTWEGIEYGPAIGGVKNLRLRGLIEAQIMSSLAGQIAETLFQFPDDPPDCNMSAGDQKKAHALSMKVTGNAEETEAYLYWLSVRMEAMLRLPWHQQQIEKLADELRKRKKIGYRTFRRLVSEAQNDYRQQEEARYGRATNLSR